MTVEPTAGRASAGAGVGFVPQPRRSPAAAEMPEAQERAPERRRLRWLPRYTWSGTLSAPQTSAAV